MEKRYKKVISIILCFVIGLMFAKTENVYAYGNSASNWDFRIIGIVETQRVYFNDNSFTCKPNEGQKVKETGNTYNINTKEVGITTRFIGSCYTGYYVSVDGIHIGNSNNEGIFYNTERKEGGYYTTIIIRNLTPGNHKIEVKADSPDYMSTEQKKDFLYVNMVAYQDDKINKSIEKIKNGNAQLIDYTIIGIDQYRINDLNLLNTKIKGKDLNASNIQKTVIDILNQADEELKLRDLFNRINSGSGSTSDYAKIGVVNVTASNLSKVNAAVKSLRDQKKADLTKEEIQAVVNDLPNKINNAYTKINDGQATLSDYSLASVSNVTDLNLIDVNWYVKGKDNSTLSKLQSNVNTIVYALNYVNGGTTSIDYYKTLGITTITSDNSTAIKNAIVEAKKAKGKYLTRAEIEKVVSDTLKIKRNLTKKTMRIADNLIENQPVNKKKTKEILNENKVIYNKKLEKITKEKVSLDKCKVVSIGEQKTNLKENVSSTKSLEEKVEVKENSQSKQEVASKENKVIPKDEKQLK